MSNLKKIVGILLLVAVSVSFGQLINTKKVQYCTDICGGHSGYTASGQGYGVEYKPFTTANVKVGDEWDSWVQICTVWVHLCPPPTDNQATAHVVILPAKDLPSSDADWGPDFENPIWTSEEFPLATSCMWYPIPVNRNDLPGKWAKQSGFDNDGVWVNAQETYGSIMWPGTGAPYNFPARPVTDAGAQIWVFAIIDDGFGSANQCWDNNGINAGSGLQWWYDGSGNDANQIPPPSGVNGDLMFRIVYQPHDMKVSGIAQADYITYDDGDNTGAVVMRVTFGVMSPYDESDVPFYLDMSNTDVAYTKDMQWYYDLYHPTPLPFGMFDYWITGISGTGDIPWNDAPQGHYVYDMYNYYTGSDGDQFTWRGDWKVANNHLGADFDLRWQPSKKLPLKKVTPKADF